MAGAADTFCYPCICLIDARLERISHASDEVAPTATAVFREYALTQHFQVILLSRARLV